MEQLNMNNILKRNTIKQEITDFLSYFMKIKKYINHAWNIFTWRKWNR